MTGARRCGETPQKRPKSPISPFPRVAPIARQWPCHFKGYKTAIDERKKTVTIHVVAALIERRAVPLSSQGERQRATNLSGGQ
jgi:hypothetical protein